MQPTLSRARVLVIGTGASGLAAAVRLHALGIEDVAVYSEGLDAGTSINTGSDKQTYYKLGLDGAAPDSPLLMARDLAAGGAVHGDIALVEAALSPVAFANLVALGVEFPHDRHGLHTGYRTDHDTRGRATSAGPYTSRDMCRALIAEARRRDIRFHENKVAVELLTESSPDSPRRIAGALFADALDGSFEAVLAPAVVFAVGGPGGLYGRSVYPPCHTGGIGLALAAGAEARNLAESQFGLASTAFRWNVSGSYMQVVPRLFSLDPDGTEREFLAERFGNAANAANALFLKGYQWPFSAGNARGSSLVDLFVYIETVLLGRRVFLDYRRNPQGFDLGRLSAEAREYLSRSRADLPQSPFARLDAMNPGAIALYRDHGIDLAAEPLEVAVCAQHNNGGLAADIWWESTSLPGLFPIGEVNGSHGIVRPGGSALNAGQVGAWRAAEAIARGPERPAPADPAPGTFDALSDALSRPARLRWRDARARIQNRMDRAAGFIRRRDILDAAIAEAREDLRAIRADGLGGLDPYDCAEALRNRSLALAHLAYLEACRVQIDRSGSRGGSIAVDPAGEPLSPLLGPEWSILPERPEARAETTVCIPDGDDSFRFRFEPCRPVPETPGWFENVWRDYRERSIYGAPRRVPAPLKWAIILGAMIPAACTAFFFFMMIGFGNGWGTSHTDPAPIALGVFALVLVVLGLPGALLWHGVRGVRPVFLAIQTIGAIVLCCLFLLLGIYWFVLHFLLLYNSSVTEYLQACRAARKAERGAGRSTGTPPRVPAPLKWAIILLPMILCQGCLSQRNGKPFTRTRNTMEELDRNRYTMFPVIGFCINFCALPINLAADVVGLPVDLAIQAFGSARICVVDEKGNPVPETDAIIKLVSGAPFFDYAVLHGRTDQKGNYRIRRRISMENGFGWEPRFVLLSKEGFCPVREVDFSAFTTSNVVTVTMPRFDPSGGYVIERTANDPACRFPPWPKMDEEWFISIGIQCARAKIYLEESWNRKKWHGYDASPFDLILSIGNHRNHGLNLTLTSARHEEARVANVPINPEGQDIVPKWAQFDSTAYLSANDFVGDNPRRAILFRLATASKENQYQYGRIDFYWEDGLPVGIRRIHFFDPKEQDIVPEPGPSRYFEKAEEKVSRRSKNTGNHR